MSEIAKAVNLQKASLYHHVSSKQEMLVDILDRALDLLIERMMAVMEESASPEETLRLAMRAYLETIAEYSDLAAVLLLEHKSLEKKYRRRHVPRRDRFEQLWVDIIEGGLRAGDFACENPRLAVKSLLGILNWTITWYRPDGALSAAEIAGQSADLFLNGLRARD
jgi:AcrR family transcriptional regulator